MTQQARKLFKEGVAAFDQSRWADARAAFVAALSLNGHYTIRGNLAASELKLGRYRDAAEHLARCVREMAEDAASTAEERAQGEAAYAEARAKIGTLVLRVNVERTAVLIDGVQVGVTPLVDPLFVEPGTRTVAVEREGYVTEEFTVNVAAGGEIAWVVTLRKPTERAPVLTPAPADPAEAQAPVGPVEPRASSPRAALLIGGAATAGAAAIAGVVFTVLSNSKATDADALAAELARDGGRSACWSRITPRCSTLHDLNAESDTFHNLAVAGFVGAGVVGAATLVYGLWPRANTETRVAPVIGASAGGVVDGGRGGTGGTGAGGRGGHAVGIAYAAAPSEAPAVQFTPGTAGDGGSAAPGSPPEGAGAPGSAGSCWDYAAGESCSQ